MGETALVYKIFMGCSVLVFLGFCGALVFGCVRSIGEAIKRIQDRTE